MKKEIIEKELKDITTAIQILGTELSANDVAIIKQGLVKVYAEGYDASTDYHTSGARW